MLQSGKSKPPWPLDPPPTRSYATCTSLLATDRTHQFVANVLKLCRSEDGCLAPSLQHVGHLWVMCMTWQGASTCGERQKTCWYVAAVSARANTRNTEVHEWRLSVTCTRLGPRMQQTRPLLPSNHTPNIKLHFKHSTEQARIPWARVLQRRPRGRTLSSHPHSQVHPACDTQ